MGCSVFVTHKPHNYRKESFKSNQIISISRLVATHRNITGEEVVSKCYSLDVHTWRNSGYDRSLGSPSQRVLKEPSQFRFSEKKAG